MDLLDAYGFIPNGGRKYYLNRSQPPVFAHMVHAYVTQTGNTSVLERALPLLDAELQWWEVNRTTTVVSPWTNKTHTVAHYAVNNSAPRPEGFVEDHDAAFGTPDHPQNLTEQQRSDLYAELASGAESGWDYTSRWCREPLLNETDNNVVLRTLNVRGIIPVDLTALMASNHYLVAELYEMYGGGKGSGSKDGGGKDSGWGGTSTSHPTGSMAPRPSMSQPASPPAESPSAERPPAKRQGADPALSVPEGANGPTPSLPPMPTPTPQGADPALNPSQGGGDGTPSDPAAAPSDGASSPAAPSPESGSPAMQPSPSPNAESPATQPSPSPNAGSPAAQPSPSPNAGSSPGQASPSPNAGSPAGTPHASTSAGGMTGGYPPSGGNHTGGGGGGGSDKAAAHRAKGDAYKAAVLDLHWDAERAYFYDYNISAHDHSPVYSPAGLWPLWLNITPPGLEGNETMALAIASGQRFILGKYAGVPSVASLLKTGLNWDFPNVWPPHVYSTIKAFETLHRLVPNATTFDAIGIPFDQVAPRQLNLDEAQLPEQPQSTIGNTSLFTNASEPWPKQMVIEIANRYMTDAFCSWYSTGGAIPGVLQQLPLSDLNATGTYTSDSAGHMFEKFNVTDPDAAGGGGEYTVQIGFGWTNGVVLWAAGRYGQYLPTPTCPLIPIVINDNGGGGGGNGTDGGNGTTHDAGANATHAGTNATQAMFRGYRIPRK
ncbi:uncharacterized protein COLE_00302 [Cutaneotrichosporon oleaginosum]|nr:hypothetical protein COLE_00302 [Cutaneotrichosporon oleaginosum]